MEWTKFTVEFEWVCSCGNQDKKKFRQEVKKEGYAELLCLVCERKFKLSLVFEEIN